MKVEYFAKPILFFVQENNQDVAKLLGVNQQALFACNGIKKIRKGDILEVPQNRVYVVKPLDTLSSIAQKLGVEQEVLRQKNHCTRVFIGQMLFF